MRQYWHRLQHSERRTVLLGATAVALALVYVVFAQRLDERSALQAQRAHLIAQERWLQEQASLLARLDNVCAKVQLLHLEPEALLQLLAQRAKVEIVRMTLTGNRHALELRGEGNDVLLLAQQSMCQGLALESIKLVLTENMESGLDSGSRESTAAASGGKARVQARLELRHGS